MPPPAKQNPNCYAEPLQHPSNAGDTRDDLEAAAACLRTELFDPPTGRPFAALTWRPSSACS